MRTKQLSCLCVLFSLVAGLAAAQPLDGRTIELKANDYKSLNVPVRLPYDGPAPDGVVRVRERATQKLMPATVRNGELVFVAEGAMPGTAHTYTVEVAEAEPGYVPRVVIKPQEGKEILDVVIDDQLFTRFHYSKDWKKPFLWPVLSEGEVGVTRDYPMETGDTPKFAQDHPHHKSLYCAYGEVNGADLWAEGEGSGFQAVQNVTYGSGDAYGWIMAEVSWDDGEHKHIMTEHREYRFYATPVDGRLLDQMVRFVADSGDVALTDTKEGGIVAVRMRPELSYRDAVITNALGDSGEQECWGKPSPWCDYSGEMKEIGFRGLAVFDYPTNLRYPTCWHVRNYGLMGANCFGYSYFAEKDYNKPLLPSDNGDYTIQDGEELSFYHRVFVHSGDVKAAAVADRHADFATPPKAEWAAE